jgi:hypothetical protein
MSLDLQETIQAKWTCDWCECQIITDSKHVPEGWVDTNCGGEPCGGVHFCSDDHYILSRNAWEEGFEEAMDAQAAYHETERTRWANEKC